MKSIVVNCPMCGGRYSGNITSRFLTCEYCDSRFALDDEEAEALGLGGRHEQEDDDVDYDADEEYAGMDLLEIVDAECEDLLCRVDRDNFETSRKIERGLGIDADEEIYLIHDDTIFKSGKNGFAITSAGLYCREMGDREAHFMSWEDFAHTRYGAVLDDSYVRVDGTSIAYYTDDEDDREQLENLYQRLQYFTAKAYGTL